MVPHTRKAMAKAKTQKTKGKKEPKKIKKPAKARLVKAEIVDDTSSFEQGHVVDASGDSSNDLQQFEGPAFEDNLKSPISSKNSLTTKLSQNSSGLPATSDPIQAYLREVRKYPLLSREEESELAKKYYENKDPQIAQILVTSNLRFVIKVAAEYSRFGARLIDLVQEGNMGLMHAVRDFNPYKGVRLITYAVWWIRGYIQEYLMKQYSLVKIGTTHNQKKLFYRLQKEKEALEAFGNGSSLALLGTKLGIPTQEVEEMAKRLSSRDLSLNQPLDDDSRSEIMDLQKSTDTRPDEALAHEEEVDILRREIKGLEPQLNEKEKIILNERLLADEPLTLQEIGEKYGITREAVRQVEARLLKKIKDRVGSSLT